MTIRLAALLLIALSGLLSYERAVACGLPELKMFEEKAQTLAPEAETLGQKLMSCPMERREAFQWLSFVHTMQGAGKGPQWPALAAKGGNSSARKSTLIGSGVTVDSAVDAAYGGDIQKLKDALDGGDPRLTPNFEVHLAVGRALVRSGQYSDGRKYYESAFRLGANDPRFDVERLYTYIWERNWGLADREFGRLPIDSAPKDFAQGALRGRALLAKLQGMTVLGANSLGLQDPRKVLFGGEIRSFVISDEMQRYSGSMEYHGSVDLRFTHHVLVHQVYDKKMYQRDVAWVGRDAWGKGPWHAGGRLGYRTQAKRDRFLFSGSVGYQWGVHAAFDLGVDRMQMLESIPLPQRSLDLVQDSLFAKMTLPNILHYQASLVQDRDRAPFSRHQFGIATPLTFFSQKNGIILGLVGFEYEARARPSPDYESFRQGVRSHIGARIEGHVQGDWLLIGDIRYLNLQRLPHGATTWTQNSGVSLGLEAHQPIDKEWRLTGRIGYNGDETLRPTQPFQKRLDMRIGADLLR